MKLKEVTDLLEKELDDDAESINAESMVKKTKETQMQRSTIPNRANSKKLPELDVLAQDLVRNSKEKEKESEIETILNKIKNNIEKIPNKNISEYMKRINTYIGSNKTVRENKGGIDFVKRELNKIKEDVQSLGNENFFNSPCGNKNAKNVEDYYSYYCNLDENLKELENLIK